MRPASVMLVLAGCLSPDLTPCGALLCADGTVCVADTVCAAPEAITACADLVDGEPCQSAGAPGHCTVGVCVANACGDGLVTGNEACDGSESSVTCAALGYYEGTPACTSSCVPDPSSCSGRCGDGVIQTQYDEQCDTLPPDEGCVTFGQDYGALTCNAFCAPAITRDCTRYGWDDVLPATTVYTAAAASAHGAIGLTESSVDVVWDGVSSSRSHTGWTAARANAELFLAVGPTSSAWFDGQWHDLAFGVDANWLSLGDDGHLVGRTDQECALFDLDVAAGTSTTIPTAPVASCPDGVAFARDELYVPQGSAGIARWTGTAWTTHAAPSSVLRLLRAGPQRLAAIVPGGYRLVDVAGASPVWGPLEIYTFVGSVAFDDDDNILDADLSDDRTMANFAFRAGRLVFSPEDLAANGQLGVGRSADGRILTFGAGVRVMRPLSLATTLPTDTSITSMTRTSDGMIACGRDVYVSGTGGFVARPFNSALLGQCVEAAGHALGAHFVMTTSNVYLYNAGNNSYGTLFAGTATSIAGDYGELWIAARTALHRVVGGTNPTAVVSPAGCEIFKLAMSANRRFVGAGVCGGKLAAFERTATTWATLAIAQIDATSTTGSFQIAAADDDSVFVRYGTDVFRIDGASFTPVGQGASVQAVTRDDFFIDRGGDTLQHGNATPQQQLRLASGPFVATRTHLYSWDPVSRRMYAVARMPSQPGGP